MTRVGLLWKLHDALMDNQAVAGGASDRRDGQCRWPMAKGEIAIGAQYVALGSPEEARRAKGEIVPPGVNGRRILVTRHPVGVVGMITPVELPVLDAGPQGCTRACRGVARSWPSRRPPRPIRGVSHGRPLAEEVGYPAGAVNVLTGSARAIAGAMMARDEVRQDHLHRLHRGRKGTDPPIRRHRQEGSRWNWVATRPSSSSTTPISMRRPRAAIVSKYRNSGQTCVCANRILRTGRGL